MPDETPVEVDLDAAAASLAEALATPSESVTAAESVQATAPVPEPTAPETPAAPAAETEVEESTERTDLAALIEGLSDEEAARVTRAYKAIQGEATKRFQEASEIRKQFEGLDPETARQAVGFIQQLETDRAFAEQVHEHLAQALQTEGLTPARAAAEATRRIEDVDWEEAGLDSSNPLVQTIDQIRRQNEELLQWKQGQERAEQTRAQEARRQEVIRDIERQDQAIRNAHPHYKEEDMDAIYKIAAATEGDLVVAEEYYRGLNDRILADYLEKKGAIPAGVGPAPAGAAHSETPTVFGSTDEAHPSAVEFLRKAMAEQG